MHKHSRPVSANALLPRHPLNRFIMSPPKAVPRVVAGLVVQAVTSAVAAGVTAVCTSARVPGADATAPAPVLEVEGKHA